MESRDASGVDVRQDEHVQVEYGVEHQRGEEEGDEAHDDSVVGVVHDEEDAGDEAGQPHQDDDDDGALAGHDAVVAQRVKDGDVAIRGDGAQERQRWHHGAADHHVDDVVQVPQHAGVHVQQAVVSQEHDYGFHHVADAHQHVGHGEAADEVVHWWVQVAVPDYCQNDQDVFHQADESQSQEQLLWDADLKAAQQIALPSRWVCLVVFCNVNNRSKLHMEDRGVVERAVGHFHERLRQ